MNRFKNIATLIALFSFLAGALWTTAQPSASADSATKSHLVEPGYDELFMAVANDMLPTAINHVNLTMVEAIDFDQAYIEAYVPLKQGDIVVKLMTAENLVKDREMPASMANHLISTACGYRYGNTIYVSPEFHRDPYGYLPSGINEWELYETICHEVLHVAVMRDPKFYTCSVSDGTVEDDIREQEETLRMLTMLSLNEAIVHTLAAEMTAEYYGLEAPLYYWGSVRPLGPFYVDGMAYELSVEDVVKYVHADFTGSYKFATCKESADLFLEELRKSIAQSVR